MRLWSILISELSLSGSILVLLTPQKTDFSPKAKSGLGGGRAALIAETLDRLAIYFIPASSS